MLNAVLGKKLHQTQVFSDAGLRLAVTEIKVPPSIVTQIKTQPRDGYWAVQLGFDNRTQKNITKPLLGHLKKTGTGNYLPRFLREIKVANTGDEANIPYKVGDQINVAQILKVGDRVKVTGTSKAKGFQGGVKRHGFSGGPRTHGQSDRERAPGSIGQTTTPGRVYKGKRMAGRMGNWRTTVSGLQVVAIDAENQILRVSGLVPGRNQSLLLITKQ